MNMCQVGNNANLWTHFPNICINCGLKRDIVYALWSRI
jgi:hypothetical protein